MDFFRNRFFVHKGRVQQLKAENFTHFGQNNAKPSIMKHLGTLLSGEKKQNFTTTNQAYVDEQEIFFFSRCCSKKKTRQKSGVVNITIARI